MSDFSRATIFKVGPMEAAEAVSEIIATRSLTMPEDFVIRAETIAFPAQDGISIEHLTREAEFIEFLESGCKSLCSLLQFPHHLLRKLSPETRAALFKDLFAAKFGSEKTFMQLRCSGLGGRRLRAIFFNRQRVFNDRDVFTEVIPASRGFTADCYWVDDYVSAIRFKSNTPLMTWDKHEISMGFDVVNSEVRDRSLEIRGVLWVGKHALIPPKLIFPAFKGKNSHIGDIRGLGMCLKALGDRLLEGYFNAAVTAALDSMRSVKFSLGWELKNWFKRDVFTTLDVLKFLEVVKKSPDPRWRNKDAYALCDMEKNTRVPALTFIQNVSEFAQGFDTYAKRSSIEFGLNLLF